MTAKNLKIALEALRDLIIEESKSNLQKQEKGGGGLEKSLRGTDIKETETSLSFDILMAEYGEYVDKGVSGVETKYNTPYSFKDKMPPPSKLDKWIVKKKLKGIRDEKGRFIKRKSLQFIIARSIYKKGLEPSLFFTNAYKSAINNIDKKLTKEVKMDVEDFLNLLIEQNKENG